VNRIIQWFIDNSVAVNLLMILILLGGAFALSKINKETVPAVDTGLIDITATYPGAGPKEVEEQIIIRIEESIGNLDGIKEISSTARRGYGKVRVEAIQNYDLQKLLNNIDNRVAAIDTFPENIERVQVKELQWQRRIMNIAVVGEVEESALKLTAERLREEMAQLPNVSIAELQATRADEVAIEVSEQTLRRYHMSFQKVADAIRGSSLNLPAGTIKSSGGDIQLQTRGQAYTANDFSSIIVATNPDGGKLLLGDIATISDGFVDQSFISLLNGKPAVYIQLYITDNPNVLKAREQVFAYLEELQGTLPSGITVKLWDDSTEMFKDRMSLLLKNASSGLILVFVVLMLFLRPILAAWVCVGIFLSFCGAIWLMPYTNVSINMLTLFGFLLVLGIVVDDAIIVGESIYSYQERGIAGSEAAALGSKQVSKPVIFAVASTMVFFAPLLFVPGQIGTMAAPIAVIVILCLAFSLVESLLILPCHLAHIKKEKPPTIKLFILMGNARNKLSSGLQTFSVNSYEPLLKKALQNNAATLSFFVVVFSISVAVFVGGWIRISFMPVIQSDLVEAQITLGEGVPFSETRSVLNRVKTASSSLLTDPHLIAANAGSSDFVSDIRSWAYDNNVAFSLALKAPENRQLETSLLVARWRQLIGDIPEAEDIRINYTINTKNAPIRLRVSISSDIAEQQEQAVAAVKLAISAYPGTFDIKDNLQSPREEIELALKENAEALGFSLHTIAQQVRQGFYGEEVQRIPRGKEDVRVMLRFPKVERNNIDQLDEMRVRSAKGLEVPLRTVADIIYMPGYSTIRRLDRKRSIVISSDLQEDYNANEVVIDLIGKNMDTWKAEFPGFSLAVDGDLKLQNEFMASLIKNFSFALMVIFGLMAVAFRSYWQPLIILTAIPFGFMGTIIGHVIMGREISVMSMLGFVACAGVVVNDNLVLLDRIGQLRKMGVDSYDAVVQAGRSRFRAIILTSFTTFIGLAPILFETSMQAKFLIPMVISLSFGVMCATTVTLFLVPCLYLSIDRLMSPINDDTQNATYLSPSS